MTRALSRRHVLGAGLAIGAAGLARPVAAAASTGDAPGVAIVGATVIDATGAPPRPGVTVLVRGGRIVDVDRRMSLPRGTTVVDGVGKFVIPGLCDMHVHSDDQDAIYPPLYLANGVTTVREMSGAPFLHARRDRIRSGALLGPRMVIASPMVDGAPSLWEGLGAPYLSVADPDQARAAVRQVKADGADFVKVYSRLTRDSFLALADEARRQGIPIAGHCPDAVPVTEAVDAGQRSVEHVFWTWFSTSSREAEIRRAIGDMSVGPGDYNGWFHKIEPAEWTAAHSYDPGKAATVFARLAARGCRQVPTLTMHRVLDMPDGVSATDERLRYLPAATVAAWQWELTDLYEAGRTPEEAAQHRELFGYRARFVDAMRRAGVPIMAGTDTGTPYAFPGFGLHDELAELVAAGFTPMRALQAATREPARYLGLNAGTVRPGNAADLVVLDADPLRDIRNTRRIHAVVVGGRLISADDRRRMLDEVAAAAAAAPATATGIRCACAAHSTHGSRRTHT